MNLFFWKDNQEIDHFAETIAGDLYSQLPPKMITEVLGEGKKNQRLQNELDDISAKVDHFSANHKMGVYKKARLHLNLMQRLEELGYDANSARAISDALIVHTALR